VETPQAIFWEHNENRAVRKGDWKLVAKKGKAWELYNLAKDRTETTNLIETNRDIANDLIQAYEVWAKKVGVKEVEKNKGK
jgi:arylsulfatase